MDRENEAFQEWELLHKSDAGLVNSSDTVENLGGSDEIEIQMGEKLDEIEIHKDYFSPDSQNGNVRIASITDLIEGGSVESDKASWKDPIPDTMCESKNTRESWPDSSSDGSDERKSSDFNAEPELGLVEIRNSPWKCPNNQLKVTVDDEMDANDRTQCYCGATPKLYTLWTANNLRFSFYRCPNYESHGCSYFGWFGPPLCPCALHPCATQIIPGLLREIEMYRAKEKRRRACIVSLFVLILFFSFFFWYLEWVGRVFGNA